MSIHTGFMGKCERGEIDLRVYIYQRPNLRDENGEMEMYLGRSVLDNCFDNFKVDESLTEVDFSYPERWLNIVEQRALYTRLEKFYPNLKRVAIKTHSVYIVQMTISKCCRIITPETWDGWPELPQESTEGKLYLPTVGSFFGATNNVGLTNVAEFIKGL